MVKSFQPRFFDRDFPTARLLFMAKSSLSGSFHGDCQSPNLLSRTKSFYFRYSHEGYPSLKLLPKANSLHYQSFHEDCPSLKLLSSAHPPLFFAVKSGKLVKALYLWARAIRYLSKISFQLQNSSLMRTDCLTTRWTDWRSVTKWPSAPNISDH